MFHSRAIARTRGVCLVAALCVAASDPATSGSDRNDSGTQLLVGARFGATPSQVARALLLQPEASEVWEPRVHKSRGAHALYPQVAPATVVVRNPWGHGTGIIVDADGWILTNHHVVARAATDVGTGAKSLTVHLGTMQGGLMRLLGDGIPALVYKEDEEKDLALLKLTRLPEGVKSIPALELAMAPPLPGSDCVVVGHPAAGMLWAIRSCEVASVGEWPEGQIDVVMNRLRVTSDADRSTLEEMVSRMPKLKIVISTCGINPGESGGPLLNTKGEIVGVTFAVPVSNVESGVTLDKFAYHIHVDEVRKFLEQRPSEPSLHVPSPWPPATVHRLVDTDEDGQPDVLAFGLGEEGPFTGLLADLDQNQLPGFALAQLAGVEKEPEWDFEFAWQPGPEPRAFYDTDDDGGFDSILIDANGDGLADIGVGLRGEIWSRIDVQGKQLMDPKQLPMSARDRFGHVLASLPKPQQEEKANR